MNRYMEADIVLHMYMHQARDTDIGINAGCAMTGRRYASVLAVYIRTLLAHVPVCNCTLGSDGQGITT